MNMLMFCGYVNLGGKMERILKRISVNIVTEYRLTVNMEQAVA
jgi:hypothetical protein